MNPACKGSSESTELLQTKASALKRKTYLRKPETKLIEVFFSGYGAVVRGNVVRWLFYVNVNVRSVLVKNIAIDIEYS